MRRLFSFARTRHDEDGEIQDEYVELNADVAEGRSGRVIVRRFTIEDFSDIKPILDVLREGNTVCLVNIRPIKEKDLVELKRSINKLKKTCEALDGDIAGVGEDMIVVTPSFAYIHRAAGEEQLE